MISVIKNLFFKNKQDSNFIKNKKWALSPIKVYIAPIKFPNYVANESMYRNMVIQAFNTWSIASGGKLKFEMTDHLINSSINIVWKKVDGHDLGHCTINEDSRGVLYGAEISIGLFATRIDEIDYDTEIYHSILHCVGIALGVPQTNNPDDIMCIPHQCGIIELSENDKQSVYNLYNRVEDSINEP